MVRELTRAQRGTRRLPRFLVLLVFLCVASMVLILVYHSLDQIAAALYSVDQYEWYALAVFTAKRGVPASRNASTAELEPERWRLESPPVEIPRNDEGPVLWIPENAPRPSGAELLDRRDDALRDRKSVG
eukprot:RCo039662